MHEFGCSYAVPDVGAARAWVFAPPVDAAAAQRLVKAAGKATGCKAGTGPPFGTPTLALTCSKDGVTRASYRGLFGDAWLVCEVELAGCRRRWTSSTWRAAGASALSRRLPGPRAGDRSAVRPASEGTMALRADRCCVSPVRILRTRVISLTTACLALGALSIGVGAAPATSNGGDRSTEPSLPHSAHGQQAIRLLGNELDEAAALNGWTTAQLRSVLANDSTAWVDRAGRVFYKDLPAPAASAARDPTAPTCRRSRCPTRSCCTATPPRRRSCSSTSTAPPCRAPCGTRRRACPTAPTRPGRWMVTQQPSTMPSGRPSRPSGSARPRTTRRSTST